jgi:hypothetical protein
MNTFVNDALQLLAGAAVIYVVASIVLTLATFVGFYLVFKAMRSR